MDEQGVVIVEPKIDKIVQALAKAQIQFPAIRKDRTAKVDTKAGGSYAYAYADLASILSTVRPILNSVGIAVSDRIGFVENGIIATCQLLHESGQRLECDVFLPYPGDQRTQTMGGIITYARRYALCAVCGIAAEQEDDDAQAAQQAAKTRPQRAAPQKVAPKPSPQKAAPKPAAAPAAPEGETIGAEGARGLWGRVAALAKEIDMDRETLEEWMRQQLVASGVETTKDLKPFQSAAIERTAAAEFAPVREGEDEWGEPDKEPEED